MATKRPRATKTKGGKPKRPDLHARRPGGSDHEAPGARPGRGDARPDARHRPPCPLPHRRGAGEAPLFADKRGNHIDVDNFKGAHFARPCGRVGLSGLRLHDLRHTWASIRLHERAELREVQEQLGHATPGFTLAVYGHLQPGDRKESMDRFSAALARARKE